MSPAKRSFTRDKWAVESRPDSGGGERPVVVAGGQLICAVSRLDDKRHESAANAHLIAAAPNLYEAVDYALYVAHRHHATAIENCKSDQCSLYHAALAKAGAQ